MTSKKVLTWLKTIVPITIGTAIYALGISLFVVPNELMEGGVTGISLLFNYVLQLPISITILVLNIPLFYFGWRILGRKTMGLTIYGTLSVTFFISMTEWFLNIGWLTPLQFEDDVLLAACYAGLIIGTGLGIVFRYGGTTGGVDIIARIGNKRGGWSMGQMILIIDAVIIGSALLFIPLEKILYTLILVIISSRVIDLVIKGAYAAKAFTIISNQPERISETIQDELERGITFFEAKGGYASDRKQVVYCVVYRHETRRLTQLVQHIDPHAFIIVSDVQSVLGEGFKSERD